jgi:ribosomal protein S18 acetylase RimI-like enzyme
MISIRQATKQDVPTIFGFICALADYEKLRHEVVATEPTLTATLFGAAPAAEVLIAERAIDGQPIPVGFALFFTTYSTFLAKPGLYLEDLFVAPAHRGCGAGKTLMTALASLAVQRGYGRFEWSVLDWNTPAIEFYRRLGSKPQSEWTVERVTGEALTTLASEFRGAIS